MKYPQQLLVHRQNSYHHGVPVKFRCLYAPMSPFCAEGKLTVARPISDCEESYGVQFKENASSMGSDGGQWPNENQVMTCWCLYKKPRMELLNCRNVGLTRDHKDLLWYDWWNQPQTVFLISKTRGVRPAKVWTSCAQCVPRSSTWLIINIYLKSLFWE